MKRPNEEPLSSKRTFPENTLNIVLILTLPLILLTTIPLYYYRFLVPSSVLLGHSSSQISSPSPSPPLEDGTKAQRVVAEKCDIFRGEWVPNPNAPYYTNETCWAIEEKQNCMKFGRPDSEFMRWRWKPNDCELPIFNGTQFLELVRGKSLAFVGDSLARNQMQSLLCLLSSVTYAVDVSATPDEKFKRWSYPTHNFTLASFWSPYLVTATKADARRPTLTGLFNLHLDEPDPSWTTQVPGFDYVILSAGHWFFHPNMYYSYRMAFRSALRALNAMEGFEGTTFLRTFSPSHLENGEWDKGGDCVRTGPLRSNETRLDEISLELYMTQMEEFRAAAREGGRRGRRFRLLNTTEAMLMRPDGHPSRYGHPLGPNVTKYNDCVHWCMPGPVDTWNDFLLHMLKMEGGRHGLGRSSREWTKDGGHMTRGFTN